MRAPLVIGLLLGSILLATPAVRAVDPLDGFGQAKFGMPVDQVRQLYPKLVQGPVIQGQSFLNNPKMARWVLQQTSLSGLKQPVDVEFRFWDNRLWTVIVYYGENPFDEVTAHLTRQYGPSNSPTGDPVWLFENTKLVTSPASHWYSLNDNRISRDAQKDLVQFLQEEAARRKANRTPVPAPPQ